jgi:hypothetical protein
MEPTSEIQPSASKIYNEIAIGVGSLLGGPLATGYLIAENFKAFNKSEKGKKTRNFTILATIIISACIILIPGKINVPYTLIPIIYAAITYFLVRYFQGHKITAYINLGGKLYSWQRAVLVGIIGLTLNLILIFTFALLLDTFATTTLSVRTYGTQRHEITFDKRNITENEVDRIADGLINLTFFDETATKYVHVKRVNDKYILSISVSSETVNDKQTIERYIQLRNDLQKQFPDNKIQLNLVVDYLDNVMKKLE